MLTSGVLAVVFQRLVRKLCRCARPATSDEMLGLSVRQARAAVGCADCHQTGYSGRGLIAEMITLADPAVAQGVLQRVDVAELQRRAVQGGMVDRHARALAAVESGWTSPAEIRRVLGFGEDSRQ